MFAIKAADPGRTASPVIQPSYEVADSYRPEERLSRGERLFTLQNEHTNTNAVSWNVGYIMNPTGSNKAFVIKRVTWSFNQPTSAQQGGNWGVFILYPSPIGTFSLGAQGRFKDSRVAVGTGQLLTTFGMASQNPGTFATWQAIYSISVYVVKLFPGAATVPTIHQVDNLDIVLYSGSQTAICLAGDTLPTATYLYTTCVEGYERNADPAETTVPPA